MAAPALAWAALPPDLPAEKLDWQTHDQPVSGQVCRGYYAPPALDLPEPDLSVSDARLFAEGNQLNYTAEGGLDLFGEVRLRQGPLYLLSDQAWVNAERTRAKLSGNLEVREDNFLLRGAQGDYHLDSDYLRADEAYYLIHNQHLRGAAWKLEQLPDGRVRMQNASMTTCAPDDTAWRLVAGRMDLDREKGFGDAYHVRMEIKQVPVFYWPWVRFPIDGKRHTGLLPPTFAYSTSKEVLDYIQPFYWNIAPNYDATFYPRYMSDRGWMQGTEFRYLQPSDEGQVFYAQLLEDRLYYDLQRWHFSAQHQGSWSPTGLRYDLDFSQVSDHSYFYDLAKGPFGEEDSDQLLQKLRFNYPLNNSWQSSLQFMGYQKLLPRSQDPNRNLSAGESPQSTFALFDLQQGRDARRQDYFQFPQLEITGKQRFTRYLQGSLLVDATQFDKLFDREVSEPAYYASSPVAFPEDTERFYLRNWGSPTAWRLHLEPGLQADWSWPWAYIHPEVKVRHSSYRLEPYWNPDMASVDADKQAGVELEPSLTVPVYSLDTGVFLERDAFGGDVIQTLEPRLFAAYIPFVEQYQVPQLFDGNFTEFNINQLYRAERTSGRDRVGDVQKATLGLTQRLLSATSGGELASLGIAKEFYFADRRLDGRNLHPDEPGRFEQLSPEDRPYGQVREESNLALQLNWQLTSNLQLRSSLLWDDYFEKTDRSNLSLNYQDAQGTHLNLGYSYTSNYLDINPKGKQPGVELMENYSYLDSAEEQAYISGVLPLRNPHLRFFFKQAWDWKRDESLDSLVGVEYTSCCWQLQLMYRDWVEDPDVSPGYQPASYTSGFAERERDAGIFFQVVFRGLGGVGQSAGDLLGTELQGYTQRNYTNE
ncbi:MAG: LPS assembly protein LptD [Marinospirillum sp.]|nr:LPS assembly protein LptD [Marinospirillum sp.]